MTAIADVAGTTARARGAERAGSGFMVEETYWGYVIRSAEPPPAILVLLQSLAWFLGIGAVVALFGLWVMPMTGLDGDVLIMKTGASIVLVAFATMLFWFASRGSVPELQVDTRLGEVREVMRNRAGKASLAGRYGFDSIGGVFIDRLGMKDRLPEGHAMLVLRYRNTAQVLPVVSGDEVLLEPLKDRLGRDLVVRPRLQAMVMGMAEAAR